MPSEPDNHKMEELLKAYAKKRQDASGAPLEMHPATRRLLQGEVARVYPKAAPAEGLAWYKMLFQFWPRVAFALGIVLLLGGTLWILNRPASQPGNVSMAKNASEVFRKAPGSGPLADYEKPVAPPKLEKSFGRNLDSAAESGAPKTSPSPQLPAVMTAPAPVPSPSAKPVDKFGLQFRDEMARNELSEKQKRATSDSLSSQNNSRLSVATPPAPGIAPPRLLEEKLAEAPAKPSPAQPASRGYLAGNGKPDTDSDAVLNGVSGTERAGKDLQTSLGRKETLAKKKASISPSAASAPGVSATQAPAVDQPIAGAAVSLAAGKQDITLYYSTATTWTNTASISVPNWAFNANENPTGIMQLSGEVAANNAQKNAQDLSAADRDGKLVGGFANLGGDGRYARSRVQARLGDATPGAVNGPVAAGNTQLATGNAGFKGDGAGVQQNGQVTGLGVGTDSNSARYSQFGASGMGGRSASPQVLAGKVLEHFQMVENGDTLRIVDSDGSIYEGKLLVAGESVKLLQEQEAPTERDKAKVSNPETEARAYRQVAVAPAEFKVSGVNRTLGQLVVLTGRLDRSSSVVRSEPENVLRRGVETETLQRTREPNNPAPSRPAQSKPGAATSATNTTFRISGTASVGGTNLIRLEAVPVNR